MEIQVYKDYDEMSKAAANLVVRQVAEKPNSLICIPSGDTPTGMLAHLVQYVQEKKSDLSECYFVSLDEWLGLEVGAEGTCKHYMHSHLFDPLNIKADRIVFFDASANDLEQECERINSFIDERRGIDVLMVGIGMNGHVGFNEPGTDFGTYAHQAKLDSVTTQVGQKYFKKETLLKAGITLGLKHLAEAKTAVLIASGEKKAPIVAKALEAEISTEVPGSIFQMIPTSKVLLDQAAAAMLKKLRNGNE
jgi:glucosamine-6-phosphate deaminase